MKAFSELQPYLYSAPLKGSKYFATITRKGDLSVSFKLELPEVHTMQNDDYDRLHTEINRVVSDLPTGVVFHKQDFFFENRFEGAHLNRSNLLYLEQEKYFHERRFLDCESYVHLILSSDNFLARKINLSIFSLGGNGVKFVDNKETGNFIAALDKFVIQMQGLKIGIRPLSREENIRLKYMYFTFDRDKKVLPDITYEDDLRIGDKVLDVYSITNTANMPSVVANSVGVGNFSTDESSYVASYLYPLTFMLPCDHIVNTVIKRVDEKELATYIRNENDKKVKIFKRFGTHNLRVYEDNEAYLASCDDENLNPCRMHFNVITACSLNKDRQTYLRTLVETAFAQLEIVPNRNVIRSGNLFWGCAPGNACDVPNELCPPTFVQLATCFLNWETNYRTAIDGIILNDRISQVPVVVDLWTKPYADKVISNRNALLLGFSGEGKSVLMNHIFSQYLEQDFSLVILDIGDSYKKLCMLYGGLYFKYELNKPLFNPFVCPDNNPDVEFIESLVDLIFVSWYGGREPERKTESVIKEAIIAYYDYLKEHKDLKACFDSFFDFYKTERLPIDKARKDSTIDTEDFLLVMGEFYSGGPYGNVFNGTVSIDIDKHSFIIFELDNVKDNPVLFPIIAHMITHTVNTTIFQKVGKKKAVWVDEAWKVLENPGMRSFLKYLYKTIRKKEGQVGIAVQDITDIPDNEIGTTIINNSAIKWMMPHVKNKNSVPIVASRCSLTNTAVTQLYSVKSDFKNAHPYTEFLVVLGNESKPYRLELSPYSYAAFTSNESENIDLYKKADAADGNMATAIIQFVDERKKK